MTTDNSNNREAQGDMPEETGTSLDQAALDALLAAVGDEGDGQSLARDVMSARDDVLGSQADIDALLVSSGKGMDNRVQTETPATELFDQNDLDALIAAADAQPILSENAPDAAPLNQATLDALLAGSSGVSAPSAEPEDTTFDQASLDALLAGSSGASAPSAEPEDTTFDQASLDALLAGSSGASAPSAEPEDTTFDQATLDALLAGSSGASAPSAEPEDTTFDQATLDALLAGSSGASAPSAEPEDTTFDQATLDALLASSSGASAPSAEPEDTTFDQATLDALLAGSSGASAPSAEPEDTTFDQATLDALLASSSGVSAPSAEPEDTTFDQATLDALLASSSGVSAPSAEPEDTPLDSSQLDALFTAAEVPSARASISDDSPLDQAALDAFLAESMDASAESEDTSLDQSQLDALLSSVENDTEAAVSGDDDAVLDQSQLDALLNAASVSMASNVRTAPDKAEGLDQADIDAMLMGKRIDAPAKPTAKAPAPAAPLPAVPSTNPGTQGPMSQEMIDALLAGTSSSAAPGDDAELRAESIAAERRSGSSDEVLLSQEDLDIAIEKALEQQREKQAAKQRALTEALSSRSTPSDVKTTPSILEEEAPLESEPLEEESLLAYRLAKSKRQGHGDFLQANLLRMTASLAAGILVMAATFTSLYTLRERPPAPAQIAALKGTSAPQLTPSPDQLKELESLLAKEAPPIETSEQTGTPHEGTPAAASQKPAAKEELTPLDKEYGRLERAIMKLPNRPTAKQLNAALNAINDFIGKAGASPRVVDALLLKVEVYRFQKRPYMARDVYRRILEEYPTLPNMDQILLSAARLSVDMGMPSEGESLVNKLKQEHAQSALLPAANLVFGDALYAEGRAPEAATVYGQVSQEAPGTPIASEALARLAQMSFDQSNFPDTVKYADAAIQAGGAQHLENEYLLAARANRALGRNEDARARLEEVIKAYPKSEVMSQVLSELCEVLDDLGHRDEAVRVAQLAFERYPLDVNVLREHARFLTLAGNAKGAAEALLAADKAGADDPEMLLRAARQMRSADALPEAQAVYEDILRRFARTAEAHEATVELAEIQFARGQIHQSIKHMEDLAALSQTGPQRLPVLMALARMYREVGLRERLAEVYKQVATISAEPEVMAQAATAMLTAGALDEGSAMADRVDLSKVSAKEAARLLNVYGDKVLPADRAKAIAMLARAHDLYPGERTDQSELNLLHLYLAADEKGKAEALVGEFQTYARAHPDDPNRLRSGANAWGDYLFAKGDFRAASDAYAKTVDTGGEKSREVLWAKYQRANALMQVGDLAGSVPLYDEVSTQDVPWAKDAGMRANATRIQQRLQGLTVTERIQTKPTGAQPKQG